MQHRTVDGNIAGERFHDHIAVGKRLERRHALASLPIRNIVIETQTLLHAIPLFFKCGDLTVKLGDALTQLIGHLGHIIGAGKTRYFIEVYAKIAKHANQTHKRNLRGRIKTVALLVHLGGTKQTDLVVVD